MGHGNTEEWFVLRDKDTGEDAVVSSDDVVRIVGVEIDYIIWAIGEDGVFENGAWRVTIEGPKADVDATCSKRWLRAHFDRCCVKDVSLLSRAVENLLDRSRDAEGKQRRVVGTREPKGDLIERFSASPRLRLPLKYCAVPRE